MNEQAQQYVEDFMARLIARNPGEPEFHQAVREVAESLAPHIVDQPDPAKDEGAGTHRRTRARHHFPRAVAQRQRRNRDQPRLPHPDEQRHRPLQGRYPLPPLGEPLDPQVPGLRADLQEQPHDAPDGRRQGRFGLQPERQVGQRGDEILPVVYDRAATSHRTGHRRSGGRHRRRRPRNRLHVRPVQASARRIHRHAHRQGPRLGRQPAAPRGHGLRNLLLRAGDARHAQRLVRRAKPSASPARATSPSTPARRPPNWAPRW